MMNRTFFVLKTIDSFLSQQPQPWYSGYRLFRSFLTIFVFRQCLHYCAWLFLTFVIFTLWPIASYGDICSEVLIKHHLNTKADAVFIRTKLRPYLTSLERYVLDYRIWPPKPLRTQVKIAAKFGISRNTVREIEKRIIRQIKERSVENYVLRESDKVFIEKMLLSSLPEIDRYVFEKRVLSSERETLPKIASQFRTKPQIIFQIEKRLIHQLTKKMRALPFTTETMAFIHKWRPLLGERSRYILDYRVLSLKPKSLQLIADRFTVTRQFVHQIEQQLVEQIRSGSANKKNILPLTKEEEHFVAILRPYLNRQELYILDRNLLSFNPKGLPEMAQVLGEKKQNIARARQRLIQQIKTQFINKTNLLPVTTEDWVFIRTIYSGLTIEERHILNHRLLSPRPQTLSSIAHTFGDDLRQVKTQEERLVRQFRVFRENSH